MKKTLSALFLILLASFFLSTCSRRGDNEPITLDISENNQNETIEMPQQIYDEISEYIKELSYCSFFVKRASIVYGDKAYLPKKIFLYQKWEEVEIDDDLIKTERVERWGRFWNVLKYTYENIEIIVNRGLFGDDHLRILGIVVTGNKFVVKGGVTVGSAIQDFIDIFGTQYFRWSGEVPFCTKATGGVTYSTRAPRSAFGDSTIDYVMMGIHDDNNTILQIRFDITD